MRHCRGTRPDGSWISETIIDVYVQLHRRGYAHSVEAYEHDELVGGLYGVAIGAAFFGESMFHLRRDASKIALVALVNRLRDREFALLDTQATTGHLRRFGCIDIPAREYLNQLKAAIRLPRVFA
jgi:leucyl/phenylalanyl-tRNA---protein transferase